MAFAIVLTLAIGVIGGITIMDWRRHVEHRTSRLDSIARELAGRVDRNQAIGRYRDLPVSYRFERRSVGSRSESWTEVDVRLARGYPIELHVRRQDSTDAALIADGAMIDVEVGDVEFDPEFLVEAAPADVARTLLDREARCYLASHAKVELETRDVGDRKVLRLGVCGWLEELPEALEAIEVATRIAGRVREAFAAVDAPIERREHGAPFRPELDDEAAQQTTARREHEVAELAQVRRKRASLNDALLGWIAAVIVLGAVVMAIAR